MKHMKQHVFLICSEKPMFEWPVKSAIDHSSDSIYANQYFANFFVDQARHSTQRFESVEKEEQVSDNR